MSLDPAAASPDRALVFEVIGRVEGFARAAREAGFEWLAEDFAGLGDAGEDALDGDDRDEDAVQSALLYLTLPSIAGMKRLLGWWTAYAAGRDPPDDLAKEWWKLFGYLADVRVWSAKDRVDPSLAAYVARSLEKDPRALVPVEFDLWYLGTEDRRRRAIDELRALLDASGAAVLDEASIPAIQYHGVLASIPAGIALEAAAKTGPLAAASMVMTVRPQSLYSVELPAPIPPERERRSAPSAPDARPAIAVLLDGYPVQSHDLLRNRLDIEEVDIAGAEAPLETRFHGTAMASLILHGDLAAAEAPLERVLKVVPILAGAQDAHVESTPVDKLPLAMIHRAVEALAARNGGVMEAVLFNHSVCDVSAPFVRRPTPWAKLLDELSHRHRILFVVSAGNVHAPIPLPAYGNHAEFLAANPDERGIAILRGVEAAKGRRGILSPAEAVNVLTVGALHADGAAAAPANQVDPYGFAVNNICSAIGLGFNRSIKPDLVLEGGRQIAAAVPHAAGFAIEGRQIAQLGQRTAAPDVAGGTSDFVRRSTGTSNAAALATRHGIRIAEALEAVFASSGERWQDQPTRAVMLKALLTHGCRWGEIGGVLDRAYPPADPNWQRRRETISRFLGFGRPDVDGVVEGDTNRITLLADDLIVGEELHEYRIPIPNALLNSREIRRISLTLSWCTPIHPANTAYRGVRLQLVDREGKGQYWGAVDPFLQPHPNFGVKGTTIHRVFEGARRIGRLPEGGLFVGVQALSLNEAFKDQRVPYALATTIEVAQTLRADIYADVRSRVRPRVRQRERV
ncbi:S8 family peptidase [Methylobacterium fujisawaense]|uniref:S8 family peptidase n=1 Tax=Methylobacterium fujisawaense TaxID=107400 RepID=UPI00313F3BB6